MTRSFLPVLLALGVYACDGPDAVDTHPPEGIVIRVDRSELLEELDGFGMTTRSLVYGTEDYLGPIRDRTMEAVFDSVKLSLGFMHAGLVEAPADATAPWNQRGNDNHDPKVMDPGGFNFVESEQMYRNVLVPARRLGFEGLTLGPILDLRTRQAWLRDIRESDYDRYLEEAAENVEAVVRQWAEVYGERPDQLYLFNEPTSGNRELRTASIHEVVDLVAVVGARLEEAGFGDIGFVVPNEETMARSRQVAEAILSDPRARRHVAAIGYHPYPYGSPYSSPQRILQDAGRGNPNPGAVAEMEALRELGRSYGVPVWMTEVSQGPGRQDFPFGSIENVLARAIHIHDNFLYAGASAFFGMMAFWDSRSHEEHFRGGNVAFLSQQSMAVLVDRGSDEVLITGMGRAVGHYARWIAPGARRLGVIMAGEPGLLVTAFENAADGTLALIVVNTTDDSRQLRFEFVGGAVSGPVRGEVSDARAVWSPLDPFQTTSSGAIDYEAPGRSVTSLSARLP